MHTNFFHLLIGCIEDCTVYMLIREIDGFMKISNVLNVAIDRDAMPPCIIDSNKFACIITFYRELLALKSKIRILQIITLFSLRFATYPT